MKARYLAAILVAVLAVAGTVEAAPSALSIAKKALKIGKTANRTAKAANASASSARGRADSAYSLASTANGKADQALARPVVTAGGITPVETTASIPASDVEVVSAACPAGQRVISGGAKTITSAGGTWTDHASADRTAWIAGGEDLGGIGGTITAYAYCVPAGQAAAASRRTYRDEARAELRRKRAAK